MSILFLRLIAECPDASAIESVDLDARSRLQPWHPQIDAAPAPYWKLPEHVEFTYHLSPGSAEAHVAITALEPGGWDHRNPDPDASSVWNKSGDLSFLHWRVVWAELGFVETTGATSRDG